MTSINQNCCIPSLIISIRLHGLVMIVELYCDLLVNSLQHVYRQLLYVFDL